MPKCPKCKGKRGEEKLCIGEYEEEMQWFPCDYCKGLIDINAIIQVCPVCGKVDVYKNDGHDCNAHIQKEEATK